MRGLRYERQLRESECRQVSDIGRCGTGGYLGRKRDVYRSAKNCGTTSNACAIGITSYVVLPPLA